MAVIFAPRIVLIGTVLALAAPLYPTAHATDTQSFAPRGARSQGALHTPSARLNAQGSWEVTLSYLHEGTVLRPEVPTGEIRGNHQLERVRWIDQRDTAALQIALTPTKRFEFIASLPVLLQFNSHNGKQLARAPDSHAAPGDLRLLGRVALLQAENQGVSWTLHSAIHAPTGADALYVGQKTTRVEFGTAVGYASSTNWRVDGQASFATAESWMLGDQIHGDHLSMSAAFQQRFDQLAWFAELSLQAVVAAKTPDTSPKRVGLSVDAGVRYFFDGFYLDAGLGYAPIDHGTLPTWRAMASVGARGLFRLQRQRQHDELHALVHELVELQSRCNAWEERGPTPCSLPPPAAAESAVTPVATQQEVTDTNDQLIWFDTGSADLSEQAKHTIRTLALQLNRRHEAITIYGHADDRGDEALNRDLSLRRATAVRDVLIEAGVASDRLTIEARGLGDPIAPNTEFGRSINRRVSFEWAEPTP